MKTILHFLFAIPFVAVAQHRAQFSTFIPVEFPIKSEMPQMNALGGVGAAIAFKPAQNFPMFFELKGNYGQYASKNMTQTYSFSNGDVTNVDVSYSSTLNKIMIGSKFVAGNDFGAVRFHVTPQIGVASMRSNIRIADPEDEDDCRPLEKKTVQRFMGFVYGGEIGFDLALERILPGIQFENTHRVFLNLNYYRGTQTFEYTNVNHMQDGSVETHQHDSRDINAEFINVTTNSIHEHKIAELYRSNLAMWGIQLGYSFNF